MSCVGNFTFCCCNFQYHCFAVLLFTYSGAAPALNYTTDSIIYREVGGNLTLSCQTNSANDTIAWYFNNVPVSSGRQGTLTLSLHVDSGGWYTCAAANRFGRVEKDFLVVVGRK